MDDVGKGFRRAVIFGAGGGIGGALAEALLARGAEVWCGSRSGKTDLVGANAFAFDLMDEHTIGEIAQTLRETPPDLVVVASGVLTLGDGTGPERSLRQIDPGSMEEVFRINTIGPALVAKHFLPLMPRHGRSVFAVLSARVGSISDNRLGGWHSYRASKAALNMLVRNFAIEMGRTHKESLVVALHPGTVATGLSAPFQSGLPAGQLTTPANSAANLLRVIDALTPSDSGRIFDWQGGEIAP